MSMLNSANLPYFHRYFPNGWETQGWIEVNRGGSSKVWDQKHLCFS